MFVHGCFWHAHRQCARATVPRRNRAFWTEKFAANRRRDVRALRELRRMGYNTAVVWECEIYDRPQVMVHRLERQLRRGSYGEQT